MESKYHTKYPEEGGCRNCFFFFEQTKFGEMKNLMKNFTF